MSDDVLEKLKFPIGRFVPPATVSPAERESMLATIATAPGALRHALAGLGDDQLDTPYRDGGWTLRQVTHHVPDSHINAYVRFKLALTEVEPAIRGYRQSDWAALPDSATGSVALSLDLLDALHARWHAVLRNMSDADFSRTFLHTEQNKVYRLDTALALYAWHSRHHTAHITSLRAARGW